MKRKIILFLIGGFIFLVAVSRFMLNTWTQSFEEIDIETSLQDTVVRSFNNGNYIYVWTGTRKILIPPYKKSDNLPFHFIKGDLISKISNSNQITIKRENEIFYLTLPLLGDTSQTDD